MRKQKFTRLACFVLAFMLLVGSATIVGSANTNSGITDKSIKDYADELNTISYQSYMDENWEYFHNYSSMNAVKAVFDATSDWTFTNLSGDKITMKDGKWTMTIAKDNRVFTSPQDVVAAEDLNYKLEDLVYCDYFGGKLALHTPGVGNAEWTLDLAAAGIAEKGLYNIQFEYYPIEGKSAAIEREFYINGKAPFAEARSLKFAKIWSSAKPDKSALVAVYELKDDDNLSEIVTWATSVGMAPVISEDQKTLTFTKPDVITPSNYPLIEELGLRFFITDAENNELRATALQTPEWTTYTLKDSGGYFANNFGFVIEPENGKIEFSMEGVNERMAIASIILVPYTEVASYDEYIKGIEQSVGLNPGSSIIKLEAENTVHTSSNGVYPIEDRTSPATSPSDTTRVVLNTIGTEKWSTAGQWIEYRFHVDSAGMYEIYSRFKQSYLDGMYVCRSLQLFTEYAAQDNYQLSTKDAYKNKYGNTAGYYNGIPFAEAAELRYDYGTEWNVTNLTAGFDANLDGTVDSYQVYLEKGVVYTLRLEVTLGSMSDKVLQIERILTALNQDYLDIIKLTGTSPEDYIDYKFAQLLPNTLVDMLTQANELEDVSNFLRETAEVASTYSGTCDQLTQLLRKMAYDEDEIARNLENFKSYVGNLGTFLSDAKTQPLQLDYMMIQPSSVPAPVAEAGFFAGFWHECSSFIQSFFRDYNSMGAMESSDNETQTSINVWLAYGRDQSQVIRNLSTNKFTPQTGIAVNLKLVNGGTLLPSILAGMGPDVYLGLGDSTVINYAIRGALNNIEEFPVTEGMTFEEWTMQYFTHASMIQLEIDDADGDVHTYGLPETQTFQMMFIRLDILNDLGLEIPKTWEDIYTAQSILESNNMEIGVNTNYKIFLYQSNGDLYADNGMRINLDSVKGLAAFEKMCNMFTQHSFPYSYNAANRFRTGEMPIILADYTGLYNQLKVFATEIEGKWTFVPVPGTIQEDGSINNTADSTIAAVVMISGIQNTEAAWDFMKWYTGDECQVEYANEMVAIIGDSAKQPTANRVALESLPWTYSEYVEVAKQFENLAAIPNYPGSYYLDRHTEFAFLSAYNDDADPSTEILSYINTINKEITRKRQEFKLETLEIGQTLASKRMNQAMNAIDRLMENYGNDKFNAAITATKYAVANQNIIRLNDAASMFEALRDEAWDGSYKDIVKVNGKTVTVPTYYINVGKQTAEEKDGGYTIGSLNELQLLYFIGQSLRDAANALASY